jgi:hypothetical protein
MQEEVVKYKILLDKRDNGIPQPNGTFDNQNSSDYHISIPLYKSFTKYDSYITIDKDKTTTIIERSNFNPFFIELGFFTSIKATSTSGQTTVNSYFDNETIYTKSNFYNIKINK